MGRNANGLMKSSSDSGELLLDNSDCTPRH